MNFKLLPVDWFPKDFIFIIFSSNKIILNGIFDMKNLEIKIKAQPGKNYFSAFFILMNSPFKPLSIPSRGN